jgi:membrane protein DedA with SNARE-associated domain
VLEGLLTHFGYLALVALLVAGGVGVPVPEELIQLSAGYLAHRGVLSFWPAVGCAWLGLVAGDVLLFRLGRAHGPRLLDTPRVARVLTPARRAFIERHFARHAILTIVVARHASGFRLPVYALAGASGVRTRTFILADGLSALASVPLVLGAGWYFAAHLEEVKRDLHEIELVVAALVAVGLAAWWWWVRRQSRRRAPGPAGGRDLPPGPTA